MRGATLSEKFWRYVSYIKLRLVRVNDSPRKVAAGFSLGVFLGVFPTFGAAIPLSYVFATLFRFNRASAVVGSLIMNPVTTPFFWSVSATTGAVIFNEDARMILTLWKGGDRFSTLSRATLVYLAGNLVISLIVSAACYFLALRAVRAYRGRRGSEAR